MRKRVDRFSWVFRTLEGNKINCEISDPEGSVTTEEFLPRRQFTVARGSHLKSGDVINGQGTMYLISAINTMDATWRFRGYEITNIAPLIRQTMAIDLVTNLEKEGLPVTINPSLPFVMEPGRISKNQGIEDPKYKILCGSELRPGDKLGQWIVQTVQLTNGIYRAEVS